MVDESNRDLASVQGQRGAESVILARLIDRYPDASTEAEVAAGMAEDVLDTTGLAIAVHEAIEGLMEVGLVVRVADLLQPTPAALRSGELELGL